LLDSIGVETLRKSLGERVRQLRRDAGVSQEDFADACGFARGAELASAKGTAFGLLNAVTEFVDHERRSFSPDHRLDSAWFGQGAALKERALEQALIMIA
jgi:transcriptional regulator with XRE-family HTH domain